VLLTTAYTYSSDYCVAANSTVAQLSGVESNVIDQVRKGQPLDDARLEALRTFVTEMVNRGGRVTDETARRFFDVGYTKQNLFEVILGIASETFASFTDRVSGVPIDDEFRPYVWTAPQPTTTGS
jgi:alkylhydroperoxidase family enzyme